MEKLFGASWKTTVIGLLAAVFAYFVQLGPNLPESAEDWGKAVFAALLFAFGRSAKDTNVSNAPNPDAAKPVS